jgi:RimJ/RimL family protein N-acetyltransferase
MNIIFREAESADAEKMIVHLSKVGAETDNLSFGKDTFNISPESEARFIDRFHRSKKDIMLIAMDGDAVVANGILERSKVQRFSHRAELSITVLREYWGKGIGSEMMSQLIRFAKDTSVEQIYLQVRSDNSRAISLYEKFGFKNFGTHPDYFKINGKYYSAELMFLEIKGNK